MRSLLRNGHYTAALNAIPIVNAIRAFVTKKLVLVVFALPTDRSTARWAPAALARRILNVFPIIASIVHAHRIVAFKAKWPRGECALRIHNAFRAIIAITCAKLKVPMLGLIISVTDLWRLVQNAKFTNNAIHGIAIYLDVDLMESMYMCVMGQFGQRPAVTDGGRSAAE